ncbi:MAG: hypothetical protein QOJ92_1226 [Frankiales bacterium]|nr:hypothetical protein [Frankiales bacterium]
MQCPILTAKKCRSVPTLRDHSDSPKVAMTTNLRRVGRRFDSLRRLDQRHLPPEPELIPPVSQRTFRIFLLLALLGIPPTLYALFFVPDLRDPRRAWGIGLFLVAPLLNELVIRSKLRRRAGR